MKYYISGLKEASSIIFLIMTNTKINHTIVKDISFSLLEEGLSVKIKADGYSMYPSIKPGSLICIEPIYNDLLPRPGEIVAWKRSSGFVVHRLVRIEKKDDQTIFITRGDSCLNDDMPVTALAGKVVRIEDNQGKIVECSNRNTIPNYNLNRGMVLCILALKKIFPGNS